MYYFSLFCETFVKCFKLFFQNKIIIIIIIKALNRLSSYVCLFNVFYCSSRTQCRLPKGSQPVSMVNLECWACCPMGSAHSSYCYRTLIQHILALHQWEWKTYSQVKIEMQIVETQNLNTIDGFKTFLYLNRCTSHLDWGFMPTGGWPALLQKI